MNYKVISWSFGIGTALLLSGCANHLENIIKEAPENERIVVDDQYILSLDKDVPDDSSFTVTLEQAENIKVNVFQVRKSSALYTPYQGWREFYEVPAGLGLFPVAICSNILSVFSFGIFPFSASGAITKYSFDGLNPFMNFESRSRVEEIPDQVERTLVDSYTENKRVPLAEEWLLAKSDGNTYYRVSTDKLGQAEIVLLSTDLEQSGSIDIRTLDIYLERDNVKCKSVPLSRRLLNRLSDARKAMLKYYSNPSGTALAECVKKLEDLSFEKLAFQLEAKELQANPAFRTDFEQNIE